MLEGVLDEGAKLMVFDFSDLTHIASDGLRVILGSLRRLRESGGRASLADASESVRNLLDAGGFFALMDEFDTTDEAIDAMLAGSPPQVDS